MLAMPTNRDLSPQTATSLASTSNLLSVRGVDFEINMVVGGSIITACRTKTANNFLRSDKNRLFWVDSDIVWEPDDFLKMVALSTRMVCVSAAYPSKEIPSRFLLGKLDLNRIWFNQYGCFEHFGMGLGFTCVQRVVIEALSDRAQRITFPGEPEPIPHIFREGPNADNEFQGEDMAFFEDVRSLGYKTHCDPSIRLGHVGPHIYWGRMLDYMRKENAPRSEATRGEAVSGETSFRIFPEGPESPQAPHHQGAGEGSAGNGYQPAHL